MQRAREETGHNQGMVLTLALNYSARTELVDAFRAMVDAAACNGGLEHLEIDEDSVSRHLYTRHLPDPDLVIRTSGEMRLSNFLLWQLAYAEIHVTPTLWPGWWRCLQYRSFLNWPRRTALFQCNGQPIFLWHCFFCCWR